jgi:hypothetical protein
MRNPNGVKCLPPIWLLLGPWLLASCAAPSIPKPNAVPAPSTIATAATEPEVKPPKPVTWIDRIRLNGVVELDEIDPALLAKSAKFDVQFKTQASQDCQIELKYPQISGLADSAWQAQLNQKLRQEMMLQMGVAEPTIEPDQCPIAARKKGEVYTSTHECVVHFAQKSLVSLSCPTLATRHGFNSPYIEFVHHSLTFDLATGQVYPLADLFKPNSHYPIRLAAAMQGALWDTKNPYMFELPFDKLEAKFPLDYYLQQSCNEAFYDKNEESLLHGYPKVCMIIPDLGSGPSRNYALRVRLGGLKDALEPSVASQILADSLPTPAKSP